PPVAEAGIVLDLVEVGIELTELLPDPLHESPDVGSITVRSRAGDEAPPMDQIVKLPVGHILPCPLDHQLHELEFGQAEIDPLALPEGSAAVELQFQITQLAVVALLLGAGAAGG